MTNKQKQEKREAKQLQDFLIRHVVVLEGNMRQWAQMDHFLGEEFQLRVQEMLAIKHHRQNEARDIHDQRVQCLEKALEMLRTCPACEGKPDEHDEAE